MAKYNEYMHPWRYVVRNCLTCLVLARVGGSSVETEDGRMNLVNLVGYKVVGCWNDYGYGIGIGIGTWHMAHGIRLREVRCALS